MIGYDRSGQQAPPTRTRALLRPVRVAAARGWLDVAPKDTNQSPLRPGVPKDIPAATTNVLRIRRTPPLNRTKSSRLNSSSYLFPAT